jgi:predicted dehydrogenase
MVAAVDVDRARLDRISEMFPGLGTEQDHHKVLDDCNVDAVIIATPTHTHYQLVKEALMAGKHVLCEKPLCETSVEAQELVELAHARKLLLMVGHVFLFNPGIVKVKELIEAGEFGTMQYLSATRTNLGPIRSDVNAAYDLATHDISIFNWLMNSEPEVVSATGTAFLQSGIEDVVCISLRYPDNVMGIIQTSWLDPKKVRQMTVVGTKQMITWDDLQPAAPVTIYDKGATAAPVASGYGEHLRISMWDGDMRLPKVAPAEPLVLQNQYFVRAIESGSCQRSDGHFSTGVVKVLEACSASMAQGGTPVEVSSAKDAKGAAR